MVQPANAQTQRALVAAAMALAVNAALLLSASPAVAGKPTTQMLLDVKNLQPAACSINFDVYNPNDSGQRIEIGAENASGEKVYSTARIGGKEGKPVSVSVPSGGDYRAFATNSAGRTYSPDPVLVSCS